jgi:hypothetical protein
MPKPRNRAIITIANAPVYNDRARISHNLLKQGGMPMSVAYRLMNPAEEHAVLSLWSAVFHVPYVHEEHALSATRSVIRRPLWRAHQTAPSFRPHTIGCMNAAMPMAQLAVSANLIR